MQAFLAMHKGLHVKKPESYRVYIKIMNSGNGTLHQGMACHTSTKFGEPTSHQPHLFRLLTKKKLKYPTMTLQYCSTHSRADFTKQKQYPLGTQNRTSNNRDTLLFS